MAREKKKKGKRTSSKEEHFGKEKAWHDQEERQVRIQ